VLHKHHLIIRVGAGLIQFVYRSHLRLATEVTRKRNAFSPFFSRVLECVEYRESDLCPTLYDHKSEGLGIQEPLSDLPATIVAYSFLYPTFCRLAPVPIPPICHFERAPNICLSVHHMLDGASMELL